LGEEGKAIVTRLKEWAGELAVKLAGNKRKRMIIFMRFFECYFLVAHLRKPINLENPYFGPSTEGYGL